ncbi:MAG: aminotransferase class III-fold pyridoxal phosphate-dependent enzyme [Deltaproteobacteria bacterium]|nr:aminotransferase class III-fold pyridoxal phosphate-dependent enzyme [Deltaproteobacteria bacterium]MBI3390693.1 aminotransferase class III-fold pyridoxal phosphate-dependent enzyme [Deltaproteobacteria bacterium]
MSHRSFARTQELFERAARVVPGGIYGHQSPVMLVPGAYPYFFERGDGSHVWDVDGNEYIDYMCSYGPIVLGHNHPKVEEAAAAQRRKGNCFNGPTELWVELAEYLVGLTPFADWAAFGKNGSDVCTWAIELAREYTQRPKIVKADGAYHGTHAWCTPLPGGTTPADTENVVTFRYNDLADLRRAVDEHAGQVAGIIVSPFRHEAFHDQELPVEGFLQGIRTLCNEKKIVFILDDVRAGFRLHLGGSGEVFGVQPDLACYCKAIANGYALSACVGRNALRPAAESVFFTGSYFTSAVPMAAALACLKELKASGGIEQMQRTGSLLRRGLEEQSRSHGTGITYSGPAAIPFMSFVADEGGFERNRRFCTECIQRGVYFHPVHNWFLSTAHSEADIRRTLAATDEVFKIVKSEFGN